jgi:20S proteasome alpha/beta subunit
MTVIAWDGHTLAADKQHNSGNAKLTCTKIYKTSAGYLMGATGDADSCSAMFEWFRNCYGASPSTYPECQKDKDRYAQLIVITPDRDIHLYLQTPYPVVLPPQLFSAGSGRDFAMAAMHLRVGAVQAVKLACSLDSSCGMGVDSVSLEVEDVHNH